jgi:hypothetical protein
MALVISDYKDGTIGNQAGGVSGGGGQVMQPAQSQTAAPAQGPLSALPPAVQATMQVGPAASSTEDALSTAPSQGHLIEAICRNAGVAPTLVGACRTALLGGESIDSFLARAAAGSTLPNAPAPLIAPTLAPGAQRPAQAPAGQNRALGDAAAPSDHKLGWLIGGAVAIAAVGGVAGYLLHRQGKAKPAQKTLGDLGKATDLVRAYHEVISFPDRYSTAELSRLATRMEMASAGRGEGAGLHRKAEVLRTMIERRDFADDNPDDDGDD